MNSYNENLHSSIVSSLSDQELEMQKAQAQMDASKFSLYYAQGATITAAEKLDKSTKEYGHQQKTHKEAVIDSDFSTNVLASANSSKSYVDESVSNTALATANVQIAANAISKLASDIGSALAIVKAADCGSEIYNQTEYTNDVMSRTALLAEQTSLIGMNTTSSISEVGTASLASKAEMTDGSIKSLLEAVDTCFEKKTEEMEVDNEALAATNTTEKAAEGDLEEKNVNYNAIYNAYNESNDELNLNLKILVPDFKEEYIVQFDEYTPAFPKTLPTVIDCSGATDEVTVSEISGLMPSTNYPVENYYVMLVKYDQSTSFSISNAESVIQKEEKKENQFRYIKIPSDIDNGINEFKLGDTFYVPLSREMLLDVDENEMELGENYVVFIMATFTNDYKKLINTYDDYLSAPSMLFTMTIQLEAVNSNQIIVLDNYGNAEIDLVNFPEIDFSLDINGDEVLNGDINIKDYEKIKIEEGKLTFQNVLSIEGDVTIENTLTEKLEKSVNIGGSNVITVEDYEQTVVFATPKGADGKAKKEYRCMFLPNDPEIIKNLLTADGLKKIERITERKDIFIFELNQLMNEILSKMKECEGIIKNSNETITLITKKRTDSDKKISKTEINKEKKAKETLEECKKELAFLKIELAEVKKERELEKEKEMVVSETPEFFFDLTIAEKVPSGSYTPVEKCESFPGLIIDGVEIIPAFDFWHFQIEPSTTDNFGNRLILGKDYIPVILTIANSNNYNTNKEYTNALSNVTQKGVFPYGVPFLPILPPTLPPIEEANN